MWHGLGGYHNSEFMNRLADLIKANTSSGMYVHSLVIGGGKSQVNGWVCTSIRSFVKIVFFSVFEATLGQQGESLSCVIGQANIHVKEACRNIANDPKLADGYHAVGISQVHTLETISTELPC